MLSKKLKFILGLAMVAVMALGSVTALASKGTSLVPAPKVNLGDISYKEGTVTVVKGAIPQGTEGKTTPAVSLTIAEGVDLKDIVAEEGTAVIVEGAVPQVDGSSAAPVLTISTSADNTSLAGISYKEGTVTAVKGVKPQAADGQSFTTAAKK